MIANLHFQPIKQEAWYLQIKDEIQTSKRLIDKMSIAEILKMYQNKKYLCDTCNKELGKNEFTLDDHIAHLINPIIYWNCEDCIITDIKNGKIFATTETTTKWQSNNK